MESAEIISPFNKTAVSTAAADFPEAVGPHMTINMMLSPYLMPAEIFKVFF